MDSRRTLLWVIFSVSLFLLWDAWLKDSGKPSLLAGLLGGAPVSTSTAPSVGGPAAAPAAARATDVPSAPTAGAAAIPQAPAGTGAAPATATVATAAPVTAPPVRVRTDLVDATIDPQGASLVRLELLKHKDQEDRSRNVVLLDDDPATHLYVAQSGVVGGAFPNHRTPFTAVPGPTTLAEGQATLDVAFEAHAGGVTVRKVYTFKRGSYDIRVRHDIVNTGTAPLTPALYLQIARDGKPAPGTTRFYSTFTGPATYSDETKFKKIAFSDIDKGKASVPPKTKDGWIALVQHYFVTAWIPPQGAERDVQVRKLPAGDPYPVDVYTVASVQPLGTIAPGGTVSIDADLFSGPQDQKTLETIAPGLDLVVDYGWLTAIAKPLFWLMQFLHTLVGNWGWTIVLLTIVIKAAFYPLSAASYKSMAKMRAVTPRMQKIREQYKDDRQKMNLAMMELYRTEKINPLGGCLPIVVQIPVFIALYWVLSAAVEMRGAPWIGWIHDLTQPDDLFLHQVALPLLGPTSIGPLPLVMVATMFVQYKLNPAPPDPVQAKVFMIMPFVFGATMIAFPSGLVLYWVVNNLLSIAQQWQITRMIEGKPLFGRAKA